jgi:hypothetical protein
MSISGARMNAKQFLDRQRPRARREMPSCHVRCTIPRSRAMRMASARPPAPSFLST